MTTAHMNGQVTAPGDVYRALLAVAEAIVSHRDLSALIHDLAGRLHQVGCFDYLGMHLHEAESETRGRRRPGAPPHRWPRHRLGAGRPERGGHPPRDEALPVAKEDEMARHLPAE